MIDTTGWKINLSADQVDKILQRSKEFSEYDHETKTTNFRILKDNLNIGSYDSNITLKCYESQQIYIEFSVPKQYLGNNIELLYPSQLGQALDGVYRSLVDRFGDFPHYKNWYLQRLDLCYAWKYSSQESAEEILKILQSFDYPRRDKHPYKKESVMWRGSTSTAKFYLKFPEFKKHDYKKLNKLGKEDLARKLLHLSLGVLRFEITYRKQGLDYLFNKKIITYKDLLDKSFLEHTLRLNLNRIVMNLDKSVLDDDEALKRLRMRFSNSKSMKLLMFYKHFTSPQSFYRQKFKESYDSSTIWRFKRDIRDAKLGLSINTVKYSIDLSVPSDLVVNPDKDGSSDS